MVEAVIFDWGGVLAPCANAVTAKTFAAEKGIDEKEFLKELDAREDKYSTGNIYEPFYKGLSKKYDVPVNVLIETHNSVRPWEVLDIAKEIKKKGYLVAMLSNQMKPRADRIRSSFDISFFDYVFFSNEIGLMKPHKDFFEYCLKTIDVEAEDCLFIDDHDFNIEVAESLGFKTILFESVEQFKKEIEKFLK